jgi:hypothetical protein
LFPTASRRAQSGWRRHRSVLCASLVVPLRQHGGDTYANGQQFSVSAAQAKELLKTGKVSKVA